MITTIQTKLASILAAYGEAEVTVINEKNEHKSLISSDLDELMIEVEFALAFDLLVIY